MCKIVYQARVTTTAHVSTKLAAMIVCVHQVLLVHDAKVISTNVYHLRARRKEHSTVFNWLTIITATVNPAIWAIIVRSKSIFVQQAHVKMVACVRLVVVHIIVNALKVSTAKTVSSPAMIVIQIHAALDAVM